MKSPKQRRLIFDIETVADPIEKLDPAQQEYLLKFATTEEERLETIQRMALFPFTSRVVAIAMLNPDTQNGKVLFESDRSVDERTEDEGITVHYISSDEKGILQMFWSDIHHYGQVVTFNGRGFDCPYLLLRSAMLHVKPTRNLMPYRYDPANHCDLLDQLTFYSAYKKFNLDFYCKAFNIISPKEQGVTGHDIGELVAKKKYREIAEYCFRDVKATAELFRRWESYLRF